MKKTFNIKINNDSFTLLELLIVIGILAILTSAAVVVLNPAELLKQARDSTRLVDLKTIDKALSLYQTQGGSSFGASNTVYVSIPDISSTCNNLGLPSLPSGWFYACASTSTFRKVDGTGWIPVNFASIPVGSLPVLPVDPINSASTGNYYTYVTGGSWVLASLLESEKYLKQIGLNDGGIDDGRFEIGNNLQLWANVYGLVGYWKFNDGSGISAADSSGNNNAGTLYNGSIWTTGKVNGALSFDGADDYVRTSSEFNAIRSIGAWVYPTANQTTYLVHKNWKSGVTNGYDGVIYIDNDRPNVRFANASLQYGGSVDYSSSNVLPINTWSYIVGVVDGPGSSANNIYLYVNGVLDGQIYLGGTLFNQSSQVSIGAAYYNGFSNYFNGLIDDVRIYNRALSTAEITAIYKATK